MASLRDIRKHISAVKSIKQITYAMKMVAAARIKRAQSAILSSRPFALEMDRLIGDLYSELQEGDFSNSLASVLFNERPAGGPLCLVLITADKGLCGSFNANLLKTAVAWLRENRGRRVSIVVVGKKGRDFLRRLKNPGMEINYELVGIFPKAGYVHAQLLAENILKIYSDHGVESVTFVYNEFKSMMAQRIVTERLLPLKRHIIEEGAPDQVKRTEFIFEPDKPRLLDALLPRHIGAQIYRALLESQAAELAARMSAMEAASKNASELIEGLTLRMNKTRQAMITTELNEIVSGSEALGG